MKRLLTNLTFFNLTALALAAPFQNLGFDDGATNSLSGPPGFTQGPASELLPGWEVSYSAGVFSSMLYDSQLTGLGWVALLPQGNSLGPLPVLGDYSVALAPWSPPFESGNPITVSQTGDIPADVQRLRFVSWGGPVELRINGEPIPFAVDEVTYLPAGFVGPQNEVRYSSADVSGFAGQTVELSFRAFYGGAGVPVIHGLDSISFIVPEPPSYLLVGLGGLALLIGKKSHWTRNISTRSVVPHARHRDNH